MGTASTLPCETTVGHAIEVTRGAEIGPALRRLIAALNDMPPGTEVRLTWRTQARLHAPYEPDVAMAPRVPLRDRLAAKRAAERIHP